MPNLTKHQVLYMIITTPVADLLRTRTINTLKRKIAQQLIFLKFSQMSHSGMQGKVMSLFLFSENHKEINCRVMQHEKKTDKILQENSNNKHNVSIIML